MKSLNSLRTRILFLFNRAQVTEWIMRRTFILRLFDDDMRRVVRFSSSEEQLWTEAHFYYLTELMLSSSRYKVKSSTASRKSVSSPISNSGFDSSSDDDSDDFSRDIVCYSCEEEGHIASVCLKKDSTSFSEIGEDDYKRRIYPCFNCGHKGHFSRDCTIDEQIPKEKEAYNQYLAHIKHSSLSDSKSVSIEAHQINSANNPDASWTSAFFYFFIIISKSDSSVLFSSFPSSRPDSVSNTLV
jgi:Zinc knuckle